MNPVTHPCRLSVYLAAEAPSAVVLRRGPSDWTQLSVWDRTDDSVQHGQWFRGRVYERRCNVSPDGRLFVYIAAKHGRRPPDDEVGEAWTAVSRPPFFTALTLWPNLGSWYGGGVFDTSGHLLLDATCSLEHHDSFPPPRVKVSQLSGDTAPWEQRILREGWTLVERGFHPRTHRRTGAREVWSKPHPSDPITLFRQVEDYDPNRYGSPHWDTYWLETEDDLVPLTDVTWADFDRGGRIVMTRKGTLLAGEWSKGAITETELYDFNPATPTDLATPEWAQRW